MKAKPISIEGGAIKYDAGKPRVDLIPPDVMLDLGNIFGLGASKYEEHNWRKGMKWSRVFAAMLRHAYKWWDGQEHDPDGQHHLDSVIWCAVALKHYTNRKQTYAKFDDRYRHQDSGAVGMGCD